MTEQNPTRRPVGAIAPERELVLFCCRSEIDSEIRERIRTIAGNGPDWFEVVALAIQHRVSPLLFEGITATAQDLLSPLQQELLRKTAHSSSVNGMVLLRELLRLHQLFEEARVPVIPYKGPVLAWMAYGSFVRREYADLDFAIPQSYIPKTVEILQAAGYSALFDSREAHAGEHGFAPGQYAFLLNEKSILVELHTERTLRYFPVPVDFQELMPRLIDVEIAGQSLRTFSVEDTLVILSVHGAKHFWERLIWILDVAQLISVQDVDWVLLMEIAAGMKSTRVLLLGLYLAHDLFGAPLPDSILRKALGDRQVQWLAGRVREQYAGISDPSAGVWARTVFRLRSGDGIGQGLRHMVRLTMSPTESDRRTVRLPEFLSPLYMLVRPWRLLREYGLGLKHRLKPDLAIYQPTPPEIVEHMLRLAGISSKDVLYDLGCGDGRIVVMAAEKYGIRAVGTDINSKRIAEARVNARQRGVEDLAEFRHGDAKQVNVSEATVITLFLGADANLRLAEQLRSELQPGARIVSRDFQIYGWTPDCSEAHVLPNGVSTYLYLWTIKGPEEARKTEPELPLHELRQSNNSGA